MRAETRHQLKQDRFSKATIEAAEATVHWTSEHKTTLTVAIVVAVALVAAVLGGWYYVTQQDEKASVAMTQALRTFDAPIRPAGMPAQADITSFASLKERAAEAHKQFQGVADNYPHTHAAQVARYFMGLSSEQLGDHAAAERELNEVASSHDSNLSAVAKFALASVYRNTNRNKAAIELYQKLSEKPTDTVSKAVAQMELASTYVADGQPLEAKRIYEQVQKDNPALPAAQLASTKLQEIK